MCNWCNWKELLDDIEELLDDSHYKFAIDTIEDIKKWIEENEHCTEKQKDAIENIRNSVL